MSPREWRILQTLTVLAFVVLWLVGAAVLGLTLAAGINGSPSPPAVLLTSSSPTPPSTPSATLSSLPSPSLSSPPLTPLPSATATPTPLPTATPTPLPTATPMPLPRHITPQPVRTVWPTPDPTRAATSPLPIPTSVPPVPVAPDAINIVVLGSDQRPEWSEWHTDAVHIISIQRERAVVSVISIPRDLYVYIPGFWMSRINFADYYGEAYGYEGGSPALVRDTILYNLGIRVDYYVRTNFDGLIGIVDTLGGVDIPVHCRLTDYWPYPDENGEYPILTLEPGVHHMDGETALWYARSRRTTSVFSRDRRQQQVLQAIWHKMRDTGMLRQAPTLWEQAQSMITTDMDFSVILDLVRVAFLLQDQNIRFYSIGREQVIPWTTPYGGAVFLPNWEAIQPILTEALAPVSEARMARTFMPVEVWNGTPNPDWDLLAADRLYRAGFPAVVSRPDRQDYVRTQIIVFSDHAKGTGLRYLQEMFRVPDDRVSYRPGGSPGFGFRLIIGADYRTCDQ
ncbi:MAG TPA: LytR family transcriptional regulator [Anaerolineales bacterium]|nr:LytR family transcriptional regulator [Anaerolineales bacterium]